MQGGQRRGNREAIAKERTENSGLSNLAQDYQKREKVDQEQKRQWQGWGSPTQDLPPGGVLLFVSEKKKGWVAESEKSEEKAQIARQLGKATSAERKNKSGEIKTKTKNHKKKKKKDNKKKEK